MATYKEHEFLDTTFARICRLADGVHIGECQVKGQYQDRLVIKLKQGALQAGEAVSVRQPRYRARMEADGHVSAINGASAEIMLAQEPRLMQSRDYPRYDLRIPCTYRCLGPLSEGEAEKAFANEQLRSQRDRNYLVGSFAGGTTIINWRGQKTIFEQGVNLSASGAKLFTAEQLAQGSYVVFYMFFPSLPYVTPAVAVVLDSTPGVDPDNNAGFITRLRFVLLSDRHQSFIDDYVNERIMGYRV